MSVKPPARWTHRSLTVMFLPHLFRNARNPAESIGPRKEKVPLDANLNHEYIKRKEKKMVKAIRSDFRLNINKPPDAPKQSKVWCITTGKWVPEHLLKLEYIFPFSLGPMVAEEVSRGITFRDSRNGMLIPRAVGLAFNEWALVIAPDKDCRQEKTPQSYIFTMLESETKSLRAPVLPGSSLTVRDLDGEQLQFRNAARLNPHSCYFHSCCAMWKSTFLENPDRRPEEFWERFQIRMDDLWATQGDRSKILNIFKPPELVKSGEMDKDEAKLEYVPSSAEDETAERKAERVQDAVEESQKPLA